MTRVVISGVGSVNALGQGVAAFVHGLRVGRCGIRNLTLFPADGFRSQIAAQVGETTLPASVPRTVRRRASRSTALALIAASEALAGARLGEQLTDTALVLGTTTGGMQRGEEYIRPRATGGRAKENPFALLEAPVFAPTDVLARVFSVGGPRMTVSTACSSGANAIGIAVDWIRGGRARRVLCGATDALCWMTFAGFNALQALDKRPCRPFDRDRAGLSLGEGAAMFVLERWEDAAGRGAEIMAEVVAYGVSADGYHLTQPRPDGAGAVSAMRRALQAGSIEPEEIDYINAHGTGTPLNDVVETRAIHEVFGKHAARIPVSSTKSQVGHCLGAAGAIEVLAALIALREQFVPPTLHLESPDPECDLDYVPNASRPAQLRTVLSNSYGFGGNNTSVVLRAVPR